ncbi:hypothetical protein N665_0317s0029 [Sinapis alba]|nr:hypothetical protein N665_0317s0029 [Sinapis alba]
MPLPWKKSKSGRISKFVSDLQQSPKHGGSLVVETGFPTSLIHLFFKNRDRLKKSSSKRNNKAPTQTAPSLPLPTRQRVSSLPPPHLLPQRHDPASVTEDHLPASKVEDSLVGDGGLTSDDGDSGNLGGGGGGGGGCCVLMVVAIKVFVVAVLALSTKKLAVGITISAFALLFLEFAVPRVLTLLNLCPDAQVRLDSLIRKLIEKPKEKLESSTQERTRNNVSFEITESFQEPRDCIEEERAQGLGRLLLSLHDCYSLHCKCFLFSFSRFEFKEEEGSTTEVSSLYSEDITESEISERYEIGSNPPLLESCEENEEEEEGRPKGDLTKAMVMLVIALAGLLGGKVLAIVLTVSSCLFLRLVCSKSRN